MNSQPIYIRAAEQISIQQPLSEEWMQEPLTYSEPLVKAVNPNFKEFLAAGEVRRMGGLMKRAIVTTLKVLRETGIEHPDAIITGTSIGSLDYTQKILTDMSETGEQTLSPTHFMQSTHNTVGSSLAIYTKTHGYNTTYSHGDISFDLALQDAWMQMQLGMITTALVGGHDEMVEAYFDLLQKAGYVGQSGMVPCGEVAMSMLLSTEHQADDLCELAGVAIRHLPTMEELHQTLEEMLEKAHLTMADIDGVMTGKNAKPADEKRYQETIAALFPEKPLLHYKHLFGENYTVSALGLYAAAQTMKRGEVPSTLLDTTSPNKPEALRAMLLLNQTESGDCSLILLKKV